MTDTGKVKKGRNQPVTMAQALAARRITDALMAWLDRFAIDAATYDALAKQADEASSRSVLAFHGDAPLVLRDIRDKRFAVIGRYDQGARYFAIPKDTALPDE